MNYKKLPIYQPVEGWVVEYPQFLELLDICEANRWVWDESDPAEDRSDLLTKLSKGELHAITTILQIFTLFEINVGDYWNCFIVCRILFRKTYFRVDVNTR